MGTNQVTQDKAAELREVTRAANEALGDLRRMVREVDSLIESGFDARMSACTERVQQTVVSKLDEFTKSLCGHSNRFQRAIENRWATIATMCGSDNFVVRMVALQVLKDAGGTMETGDAKWHLVREKLEPDGSPTFAFPKAMGTHAKTDPATERAVRMAVSAHQPGFALLSWQTAEEKGIDEE